MMEKSIEKHIDDIMNNPGVTGVVCADAQGLCVTAQGIGQRASAGQLSGLIQQASDLHSDAKDDPVICIETDAGSLLVKSHDGITLGIHKSLS